MTSVPFIGFDREPADLGDAMRSAADRVLASGWFVLGPEVESFEQAWGRLCRAAAIGVGNGMDAIEIALRGLGIGPGDEVITTPMTAYATVLGIMRAGATPVLADIDPETALLSMASAERCLTPRTRAILLVHLYGQLRDMREWADFADSRSLHLIEDCAQSHLAEQDGTVAGAFGRAGAYSFYPTKNLGAIGDAGALVTRDEELARLARSLRNYGQSDRYHHPEAGLNSRLDELQAALLSARLPWLAEFTQRRRDIAEHYRSTLDNPHVRLLAAPQEPSAHVHHLFVVTSDQRDALARHLADRGVQTLIHYPVPAHEQPPTIGAARDPRGLPAAELHARTCLSLPCHPQLSDAEVEAVVEAVNAFNPE